MTAICNEWATKEKVDLTIDFITSNGDKLILTAAAEAQAKAGHDILTIGTWYAMGHADMLEPVDDVVKTLSEQNGKVVPDAEYLGTADGHWIATPAIVGTQTKPPCARIDLMKQFTAWIPGRSATASSEADFHVFAKLSKDGLERGFEPEAFAGCEVGGEDDLLDVLI
jgi:ABC-type glycerol-3-phosphate transport system substrate-binding protein